MKKYSLGIVFSEDLNKVLLIRKNHPATQLGKLNGVGGLLREGESAKDSIVEKFTTESSINLPKTWHNQWREVLILKFQNGDEVTVFCNRITKKKELELVDEFPIKVKNSKGEETGEQMRWYPIELTPIPASAVYNLQWIIPLCKERLAEKVKVYGTIQY